MMAQNNLRSGQTNKTFDSHEEDTIGTTKGLGGWY